MAVEKAARLSFSGVTEQLQGQIGQQLKKVFLIDFC
jgi:hypothetical protein